jgi:sulfoxide reductase catalytic subunit YedY
MLIKRAADIRSSEITDKKLYLNRREFLGTSAATAAAVAAGALGTEALLQAATPAPHGRKLDNVKKSALSVDEKPNKWEDITTYNNYY